MKSKEITSYWDRFLETGENRKTYGSTEYSAWHFCDNKEDADSLAELVLKGIKRGTASLPESYAVEGEPLPVEGCVSIIIDWEGNPRCIIETTKIHTWKFRDVPAEFAAQEGEGDKTLKYWKRVHREAFSREAEESGFAFSDESVVICEEFRVIYS